MQKQQSSFGFRRSALRRDQSEIRSLREAASLDGRRQHPCLQAHPARVGTGEIGWPASRETPPEPVQRKAELLGVPWAARFLASLPVFRRKQGGFQEKQGGD